MERKCFKKGILGNVLFSGGNKVNFEWNGSCWRNDGRLGKKILELWNICWTKMHDQWCLAWKENNRLKIMVSQKKSFVSRNFLKESLGKKKKEINFLRCTKKRRSIGPVSIFREITTTRLLESRCGIWKSET